MPQTNKKRIWSSNELIIAYYIAKHGYAGLKISEHDFVEYIIGDTTMPSLRMQVANFRYLLNIEGYQLAADGKQVAKSKIVEDLQNLTATQVRRIIKDYVDSVEDSIEIAQRNKANREINKKKDALNAQEKINFENKLSHLRRYRRLVRKQ